MPEHIDTEIDVEQFVAAYMKVTGGSEEEARGIVDVFLDPDPGHFVQALNEWASNFDATQNKQEESC
jgi:hypothetical protein